MLRSLLLILLGVGGIVMEDVSNHALYAQGAYPRVIGPTGRAYGPTQAHYQYERQYGHAWPGGPAQYDPNTGANFQVPNWGWGGYSGYGPGGGYYPGNLPFSGYGYGYGDQRQGFPWPGAYGVPGFGGYSAYSSYQNQFGFGPIQQYQVTPQFGPVPTFSWQPPDQFPRQSHIRL